MLNVQVVMAKDPSIAYSIMTHVIPQRHENRKVELSIYCLFFRNEFTMNNTFDIKENQKHDFRFHRLFLALRFQFRIILVTPRFVTRDIVLQLIQLVTRLPLFILAILPRAAYNFHILVLQLPSENIKLPRGK